MEKVKNNFKVRGERGMDISKEEKKIEAVARMEALGIYPETVRQFEAVAIE